MSIKFPCVRCGHRLHSYPERRQDLQVYALRPVHDHPRGSVARAAASAQAEAGEGYRR